MRLHPLSIPYRIAENSAQIAGALVVGAFAGASGGTLLESAVVFIGIAVVGIALVAGWNVAYYRRFEYELTADTFDIHSGVLSRREREIPYQRIQNVDIRQNAVQRLLGIAEVRLETAGGGQTEAELKYVDRAEATRLQEDLGTRKRSAQPQTEESERDEQTTELFAITPRELAILGVVSMDLRLAPLLVVGLSVFGPAAVAQVLPDIDQLFVIGPLVGVATILGLAVVSGVISMLQYYDFTLRRRGEEYRYERGLIQRYSGSIPIEKVQTVSIRESVLARWLGYASLTIETAGYAPNQGSGARSQSAIPIAERDRVLTLARSIEPFGDLSFERPPKRARQRYAVRYLLVALALIAVAYATTLLPDVAGPWYLSALVLPIVPIAAHLKWRSRGYHLGSAYVITRNGFWSRRTTVVPTYRVQTVFSSRTIFQRRRRLASVVVDTAGSSSLIGDDAVAADIDADRADQLREDIADSLQAAIATHDTGLLEGTRTPSLAN
ncbi:MAG: PH domain-containing protein [Halorhabdus sp.]